MTCDAFLLSRKGEEPMNHLPELIELVKHPAIQSRRGEWQHGDKFFHFMDVSVVNDISDFRFRVVPDAANYQGAIWLPPLSDPIQPERGLTGLLNERWELKQHMDGGFVLRTITGRVSTGPTPEIAVAKALISQWEEK